MGKFFEIEYHKKDSANLTPAFSASHAVLKPVSFTSHTLEPGKVISVNSDAFDLFSTNCRERFSPSM